MSTTLEMWRRSEMSELSENGPTNAFQAQGNLVIADAEDLGEAQSTGQWIMMEAEEVVELEP